jgi:cell fate (sporulation/competence/biofilm development) regulator YlbF (YheA/YmcA/DUF963 family)
MGKNITIYADDETEKILNKYKPNKSKIFKLGASSFFRKNKETKELIEKEHPDIARFSDDFQQMPTAFDIDLLNKALEDLPDRDMLEGYFKTIPSAETIRDINNELDKTIEKLERIKELTYKNRR